MPCITPDNPCCDRCLFGHPVYPLWINTCYGVENDVCEWDCSCTEEDCENHLKDNNKGE